MRFLSLLLLSFILIPCANASLSCQEIFFITEEDAEKRAEFAELQTMVSQMGFKSQDKYLQNKPNELPSNPQELYKNHGWQNWKHYLGRANNTSEFKSYVEAQEIVAPMMFKSSEEYWAWENRPFGLPGNPSSFYKHRGWQGWPHFLGFAPRAEIKPYSDVQAVVSKMGFKSEHEYLAWQKRPEGFPAYPRKAYKDKGWQGWPHFLGSAQVETKPFTYVQAIVSQMGFKSSREYRAWRERPQDFPHDAAETYKDKGWKGWSHFLGNASVEMKPFAYVQAIVSQMGFKSREEYQGWKDRLEGFPGNPSVTYKDKGWQGWAHFLGYELKWKSYAEVQAVVSQMDGFVMAEDYLFWEDRPEDFPKRPDKVYQGKGWEGWQQFFGYGGRRGAIKMYDQAQAIVVQQNFKTYTEYTNWKNRPVGIPSHPEITYRGKGWRGWKHYLTHKPPKPPVVKPVYKSFEDARTFVRQQGFSRAQEFNNWIFNTKPDGIPKYPRSTYAKSGWISWEDFLGNSKWMSYEEAKAEIVRSGIKNTIDFRGWIGRPLRIPAEPERVYGSVFSWRDFLSNPNLRESPFTKKIKPYEEAQVIVAAMGFKTQKEYYEWKKPEGIPFDPDRLYKDKGWNGWAEYLGNK